MADSLGACIHDLPGSSGPRCFLRWAALPLLATLIFVADASAQSKLPPCPKGDRDTFNECFGAYHWLGADYVGEWKYGRRSGQGTYTTDKGDKYVGEWKDDKENGKGTYLYANGDVYVGEWKGGKRHGKGTLTYANGETDDGLWKNGERDYSIEFAKYLKQAEDGDADAQRKIGRMYAKGEGVRQDYAEGFRWTKAAALGGNLIGQSNLGVLFANGWGIPQNYAEAIKWWRMAADGGEASAQLFLGMAYRDGSGVAVDLVRAHAWLNLAAGQNREHAARFRDDLAREMTAEQIAEAQSLASSFGPNGLPDMEMAVAPDAAPAPPGSNEVALIERAGTLVVEVEINGVMQLPFTVDSGAAVVTMPSDVVSVLWRLGAISEEDLVGNETYVLADGSTMPSATFRIKSLKVGEIEVHDVLATIAPTSGSLLLGQSFLKNFQSWSIDNQRKVLILDT